MECFPIKEALQILFGGFFSVKGYYWVVLVMNDKQGAINNELTQTDVAGLHAWDGQVVEENLVHLSPPQAIA